jgi:hypothetical protein
VRGIGYATSRWRPRAVRAGGRSRRASRRSGACEGPSARAAGRSATPATVRPPQRFRYSCAMSHTITARAAIPVPVSSIGPPPHPFGQGVAAGHREAAFLRTNWREWMVVVQILQLRGFKSGGGMSAFAAVRRDLLLPPLRRDSLRLSVRSRSGGGRGFKSLSGVRLRSLRELRRDILRLSECRFGCRWLVYLAEAPRRGAKAGWEAGI